MMFANEYDIVMPISFINIFNAQKCKGWSHIIIIIIIIIIGWTVLCPLPRWTDAQVVWLEVEFNGTEPISPPRSTTWTLPVGDDWRLPWGFADDLAYRSARAVWPNRRRRLGVITATLFFKSDDWQASTSDECCSSCDHRHTRVRPRTVADTAHRTALAQRAWASHVQVLHHGVLQGQAPQYLVDLCLPVSDVASRQHLRSTSRWLLVLPRHRLQTYRRRAFSVAGPSAWNSLPDNLRDSSVSRDSFCKLLKSCLFTRYWNIERIRGSMRIRYTNLLRPTYLLKFQSGFMNYNSIIWYFPPRSRRRYCDSRRLSVCLSVCLSVSYKDIATNY